MFQPSGMICPTNLSVMGDPTCLVSIGFSFSLSFRHVVDSQEDEKLKCNEQKFRASFGLRLDVVSMLDLQILKLRTKWSLPENRVMKRRFVYICIHYSSQKVSSSKSCREAWKLNVLCQRVLVNSVNSCWMKSKTLPRGRDQYRKCDQAILTLR